MPFLSVHTMVSTMSLREFTVPSSVVGTDLHCMEWSPESPIATLQIAHGMNEYAVKMSRRQANAVGAARVRACWEYVYAAISGVRSGELTAPAALLKVNAQLFYGEDANMPR